MGEDFERIRQISAKHTLMGSWKVGDNSRTNETSTMYTVGSSYHPDHKFWRYSHETRQLDFVEKAHMHGGTGYGKEWDELNVTATLHNALLKPSSGIVPWSGETENGFVTIESKILNKGSILWGKYTS